MSGPETSTTAASAEAPAAEATPSTAHPALEASDRAETSSERLSRKARRGRLYARTIAVVGLVSVLIALAASNTARVTVHWLFGSSTISLVWLVLVVALVAWTLGLLTSARLHSLTRAPRPRKRSKAAQPPSGSEGTEPTSVDSA
jgi:uncharacterized integral membrane protein